MHKILLMFVLLFTAAGHSGKDIIIDSDMTFEEATAGTKAPDDVLEPQRLINAEYYGYDGNLHRGQLVVHKDLVKDVKAIFNIIKERKFPVKKCIPIVKYGWDDNASMADNNTSAFNYRFIAGTKKLSNHSFGKAIDINPFDNPYIGSGGHVSPKGADYKPGEKGVIGKGSFLVKEFKERGWRWGGDWNSAKDYQHFDKAD